MPLHPEYEALLSQMAQADAPDITEVSVAVARDMFRMMQPPRPDITVGSVDDHTIPVRDSEIPIRIYRPPSTGPHALVVMLHGGGWVIGDLDTADAQCREICSRAGVAVLSVDYRLAPEYKFPTAVNDARDALAWSCDNASSLNIDRQRIAIAGDSAGGNLAAVVALMNKTNRKVELCAQVLIYPVTDGTNLETLSYRENAEGYMLGKATMQWFWDQYTDHAGRTNPNASPLLAEDVANLPPALVLTAEFDPLRDEGEAYAMRLKDAGTEVELIRYNGFIHGFIAHLGVVPATERAIAKVASYLKEKLGS